MIKKSVLSGIGNYDSFVIFEWKVITSNAKTKLDHLPDVLQLGFALNFKLVMQSATSGVNHQNHQCNQDHKSH